MQSLPQDRPQAQGPAGPDDPNAKRACDQCRLRKIRCDKDWPCSNCRIANRSCTSTGAGQRPKEHRQRILISSQYERKIDQIDARLSGIETLLRGLTTARPLGAGGGGGGGADDTGSFSRGSSNTPGMGSSGIPSASPVADYEDTDEESTFGGDSGFTSQTAFASEFLENAVERTSLGDSDAGIAAALINLRQLVEIQKRRSISDGPRFPLQKRLPPGGLSKLPMPPTEAVIPILKQSKESRPSLFSFSCALVGIPDFSVLCRQVYFPTDGFSHATFAIVNSGLYNIFMEEASLTTDVAKRDEYHAHASVAQANLETYLANLPLFMSAKIENAQALLLGSQYAIDKSKPSVAWQLNTMAAQLCQAGGYHRAETLKSDPPDVVQVKTIVFWQAYLWDRGLGLRLGRAPIIQDCDITIPYDCDFSGFLHLEESALPRLWLRTSMLQGRIYKELYSPAAMSESPAELSRRARDLSLECRSLEPQVIATRDETFAYFETIKSTTLVNIFIKGDEVQFFTTMTLVYRAIPAPKGSPGRFCIECLDTARKAIMTHMECIGDLPYGSYVMSIYVHWNLMLTPFAPFFVLFCHVVDTLSAPDLKLLQEFVASIERMREASETIDKLYRVFQIYRDVAVVYVDAKSRQQKDQTMAPINDEFDMYLSQLGLMPPEEQSMGSGSAPMKHDTTNPMSAPGGTGQQSYPMAGWFSGSRDMFGLLEEDLSNIDANKWMNQGSM